MGIVWAWLHSSANVTHGAPTVPLVCLERLPTCPQNFNYFQFVIVFNFVIPSDIIVSTFEGTKLRALLSGLQNQKHATE